MVVPVRAAPFQQLPQAARYIRYEEKRSPALVLLNVDSFMRTNGCQFLPRDRQDDMPENDAAKRQCLRELAAARSAVTIGNFKRSGSPPRFTTCSQCKSSKRKSDG